VRAWAGTLLAGAAGAVNLVALVALGGAFAGIVTGNLVTAGDALTGHDVSRLAPIGIAVGGFTAGAALWAASRGLSGPLVAELVLLAAAVPFQLARAESVVLALLAVAMGGQSIIGLRLRTSTTYMTGILTTAAHAAVAERDGRAALGALRQLVALVVGAVVAALLPTAVALLVPIVLVAAAAVLLRGSDP
jgi:uncharacterized membrane protein YoaK (UPF0700 family)